MSTSMLHFRQREEKRDLKRAYIYNYYLAEAHLDLVVVGVVLLHRPGLPMVPPTGVQVLSIIVDDDRTNFWQITY